MVLGKIATAVATDRIKKALARRVPAANNVELIEGREVLKYRENPVAEWIRPYFIYSRDNNMLLLNTGDRYIEVSIAKVKRYYSKNVLGH